MKFPEKLNKDNIAYRASMELEENSYVNLGIGLPSLCAKYIDKKKNIRFQAENGVLGFDELSQSNLQNQSTCTCENIDQNRLTDCYSWFVRRDG